MTRPSQPEEAHPGASSAPLLVPEEAAGERLDVWLARHFDVGRRHVQRALAEGRVRVEGRRAAKGQRLRGGERIQWRGPVPLRDFEPAEDEALAQRLRVLHRDRWLLAVDKPAGVPCHPLRPEERGTVLGAMRRLDPAAAAAGPVRREGGLLHRLDTDTSGVLLFARSPEAFEALAPLVRRGASSKLYRALCHGHPAAPETFRGPLAAHPSEQGTVVVCAPYGPAERWRGRPVAAETELLRARPAGPLSEVLLRIRRAWRHQIRAHLAAAGHPIVGDTRYGAPPWPGVTRHLLHAWRLELPHPEGRPPWRIEAPSPPDLRSVLKHARRGPRSSEGGAE